MRRRMIAGAGVVAAFGMFSTGSALAAGPPDRADDPFVCPVLTLPEQAQSSGHFTMLPSGEYTFGPGAAGSAETFNGNVPNHATNGDGAGTPPGGHASPGDTDYTAIWSGNN